MRSDCALFIGSCLRESCALLKCESRKNRRRSDVKIPQRAIWVITIIIDRNDLWKINWWKSVRCDVREMIEMISHLIAVTFETMLFAWTTRSLFRVNKTNSKNVHAKVLVTLSRAWLFHCYHRTVTSVSLFVRLRIKQRYRRAIYNPGTTTAS